VALKAQSTWVLAVCSAFPEGIEWVLCHWTHPWSAVCRAEASRHTHLSPKTTAESRPLFWC